MNIDTLLKKKRDEILEIAARHGARKIRVFGSVVAGKSGPDSDIDFLVDLEPGKTLLDIVAIKQDLEDILDCPVDVVTEEAISPYIRSEIVEKAISV